PTPPFDAVNDAQSPRSVPAARPEQKKSSRDDSARLAATNAQPSSTVFKQQPDQGKILGFDFSRDPLDAKRPMQTPEEIMKADEAARPGVMDAQKKLLETRYNLTPKLDPQVIMSRGKPLPVGPTARLKDGLSWEN